MTTLFDIEDALSHLSLEETEKLETLVLRHKALLHHPTTPDSALLQEFAGLALSFSKLARMRELRAKSETLNTVERAELLSLAGEEEELAIRRTQIVGELAALRRVAPRDVMVELGLLSG